MNFLYVRTCNSHAAAGSDGRIDYVASNGAIFELANALPSGGFGFLRGETAFFFAAVLPQTKRIIITRK